MKHFIPYLVALALVPVLLAFVALPAVALIDAVRTPTETWQRAGRSKLGWVAALFVVNILAAVPYWVWVRRDLRRTPPSR